MFDIFAELRFFFCLSFVHCSVLLYFVFYVLYISAHTHMHTHMIHFGCDKCGTFQYGWNYKYIFMRMSMQCILKNVYHKLKDILTDWEGAKNVGWTCSLTWLAITTVDIQIFFLGGIQFCFLPLYFIFPQESQSWALILACCQQFQTHHFCACFVSLSFIT
jgi:hypothetical protein